MKNPSSIVSKDTLITQVWEVDFSATDNNAESYISFVRKKLQYVESKVKITVVRMAGYKLEDKRNE